MAWNMRIDSPHHSECSPPWLQPVEHSFPLSPKALSCTAGGENLYFFAGLPFPERDFPFGLCFTSASWFASACFPWNCSRPLTPHNTKKTLQNSLHIVQLQSVSPCIPLGKKRSPKFCRVSRHTSQAMRHRPCGTGGSGMGSAISAGAAVSFALLGILGPRYSTRAPQGVWDISSAEMRRLMPSKIGGSGMAKAQATSQNRLASRRFLRTGLTPRSIRTNAETLRSIRSNMINICS